MLHLSLYLAQQKEIQEVKSPREKKKKNIWKQGN